MAEIEPLDYLIIGAGPAGLQMGYFLERWNRSYRILESGETPGTFFTKFPRHGRLVLGEATSQRMDNPTSTLHWNWNSLLSENDGLIFRADTQQHLSEAQRVRGYLVDFAAQLHLRVQCNTAVQWITRGDTFCLYDQRRSVYRARRLIIATGLTRPYVPPIPGIELCEGYFDFSVDPTDFRNQRILIIGKGYSAFETANHLANSAALIHLCSPTPIARAWKAYYSGTLRALNYDLIDGYEHHWQGKIFDAQIEQIKRKGEQFLVRFAHPDGGDGQVEASYDRVLYCTGFRFDNSIFAPDCRPQLMLKERFPQQTSEWESTNVPDLYFAGTLMQARDHRKTMSGFIHGFRYNVRALHHILEHKYFGHAWPCVQLSGEPSVLANHIYQRLMTSSALFLQPGFICDVLVYEAPGTPPRYYEELPRDYALDHKFVHMRWCYTISIEDGNAPQRQDSPANQCALRPERPRLPARLQPVIRQYNQQCLLAVFYPPQELEQIYAGSYDLQPLVDFIHQQQLTVEEGSVLSPGLTGWLR